MSKPYTAFFSDENLKSIKKKDESSAREANLGDELDYSAPIYNQGDADQLHGDENDFGDGDMDMDDGGYDED